MNKMNLDACDWNKVYNSTNDNYTWDEMKHLI